MNIETLLYDEIETEFDKLRGIEYGSEQYKATVDGLTKLMDRAIEMEKVNNDCVDKTEIRENDKLVKIQQLEDDRKDRWIKNGIGVAGVVLPILVTIWGTKTTLKFEETGSFTTSAGRGFVSKLFRFK